MGRIDGALARLSARIAAGLWDHSGRLVATELERRIRDQLLPELRARVLDELQQRSSEKTHPTAAERPEGSFLGWELYLPNPAIERDLPNPAIERASIGEYMSGSMPVARDFLHPKFIEFAELCGLPLVFGRKSWEWAFIYEKLQRAGVLLPGKRGLGFGVGREMLPSLFARTGASVTATDTLAPPEPWRELQVQSKADLFSGRIIERSLFDQRVTFEACDMSRIPEHLTGYDFCWSSCAFEHLGTLEQGLEFVIESVEKTLVVGGVACHTTEFNLSSDETTIESGISVFYRRRDLLELCRKLEERGHYVEPLRLASGDLPLDYLVDTPPYGPILRNPHLKLRVGNLVATSLGLVVQRGR
jgi:hypothetical protein